MTGYWPPEKVESDVCLLCGLEGWGCVCDPARPRRKPSDAEVEAARRSRMTRAELASERRGSR